jgi:hypothetical protein
LTRFSSEWQRPSFNSPQLPLLLGLLLAFLIVQMYSFRPTYRLEEVVLLLFSIYAAYKHERFLVVIAVVFAPLLALLLARWIPPYQPGIDKPILNAAMLAIVIVGLVKFVPSERRVRQIMDVYYPGQAVSYMREHPVSTRVLNYERWGGYLDWKHNAGLKVFIDGRWDLFEAAGVLQDYLSIARLEPTTPFLLRKYRVDACLLARGSALDTYLSASPGWRRVYQDRISTIFVRGERSADGE